MINAIIYLVLVGSIFTFGPRFLLYLLAMYVICCLAGTYCKAKIVEYDAAIRRRISEATGKHSIENAEEYGEFVRKATVGLGILIPVLPFIAIAAGIYFAKKTEDVTSGLEYCKPSASSNKPGNGFVGKFEFCY